MYFNFHVHARPIMLVFSGFAIGKKNNQKLTVADGQVELPSAIFFPPLGAACVVHHGLEEKFRMGGMGGT